jgi:ABC-type branched-subunit amino acid transport system substrate-binding protein
MNEAVNAISDKVAAIQSANTDVTKTIEQMADAVNAQRTSTVRIQEAATHVKSQTAHFENSIRSIQDQANALYSEAIQFVQRVSTEPGVSDAEVIFGQSAPFTGTAKSLGLGIRSGIEMAFQEAAAAGGVHGRMPRLVTKDDAYDPETALTNVRDFVRKGEVFGLVGAVGTPTSRLSERIARGGRVPFIGPVTGAGILRTEASGHVINIRASYAQEAKALVDFATCRPGGIGKSALFFQADAYGLAVRDALAAPLQTKNAKLDVMAPYDRATGDVSEAVRIVSEEAPDTVFMAGTPRTTSKFVSALKKLGVTPTFLTISFVDADALAAQIGSAGEGIVISQVVPLPGDRNSKLIEAIRTLNAKFKVAEKISFAMIEGYVIGNTVCEALRAVGPTLSREGMLKALLGQRTRIDIRDFPLQFSPSQNSGSDRVYLSKMRADGEFEPVAPVSTSIVKAVA